MVVARRFIHSNIGALVVTQIGRLNGGTNNQDKGMVLLQGLNLDLLIWIRILEIEGDSKLIMDAIKGLNMVGQTIEGKINDICKILLRLDTFEIRQMCREGNIEADTMTALGLGLGNLKCWRKNDYLPTNGQRLLSVE